MLGLGRFQYYASPGAGNSLCGCGWLRHIVGGRAQFHFSLFPPLDRRQLEKRNVGRTRTCGPPRSRSFVTSLVQSPRVKGEFGAVNNRGSDAATTDATSGTREGTTGWDGWFASGAHCQVQCRMRAYVSGSGRLAIALRSTAPSPATPQYGHSSAFDASNSLKLVCMGSLARALLPNCS